MGCITRDAGQSLVPLPPDSTTGTMMRFVAVTMPKCIESPCGRKALFLLGDVWGVQNLVARLGSTEDCEAIADPDHRVPMWNQDRCSSLY